MNLSSCKRKTLIDIYGYYKYKKNIPHKINTRPKPHVAYADCTDHRLSADWYEWQIVVKAYLEKLKLFLEDGNSIELGSRTGAFCLTKLKCNRFIDFKKSKEQGKPVKFAKSNADNYYIMTSWTRSKIKLKLRSYWRVKLNRTWVKSIYKACETDFTKIYKIRDA